MIEIIGTFNFLETPPCLESCNAYKFDSNDIRKQLLKTEKIIYVGSSELCLVTDYV